MDLTNQNLVMIKTNLMSPISESEGNKVQATPSTRVTSPLPVPFAKRRKLSETTPIDNKVLSGFNNNRGTSKSGPFKKLIFTIENDLKSTTNECNNDIKKINNDESKLNISTSTPNNIAKNSSLLEGIRALGVNDENKEKDFPIRNDSVLLKSPISHLTQKFYGIEMDNRNINSDESFTHIDIDENFEQNKDKRNKFSSPPPSLRVFFFDAPKKIKRFKKMNSYSKPNCCRSLVENFKDAEALLFTPPRSPGNLVEDFVPIIYSDSD